MGELYICADANFSVENNSYNEHVIKKWNSLIKDEDIVLVTGIFADNLDILKSIVPQLKGKVELINWNGDNNLKTYSDEEILSTGIKKLFYANGWVRGIIGYEVKDVIIPVHKEVITKDKYYYAAPESLTGINERYRDKILNLSIKYWDYAPIVYNQIPTLIDNCLLFEQMTEEEIDLNA